jgi:SAM-dependent methyltransferase
MESEQLSGRQPMNPRFYCTLFDAHFLSRGLAMIQSLREHSSRPVHIFVLAMDEGCCRTLEGLEIEGVTVLDLERDFLDQESREARANRPWREFCWTCSSALIRHLLLRRGLPQVTYLDADICFFSDPEPVFDEFSDGDSALITEHHYFPAHDQSEASGRFCVQFLPFNNNGDGREVLERWYRQCLEFCGLDPVRGLCGDQKYLDEWPDRYQHVRISSHRGAGLAPWNVESYRFESDGGLSVRSEGRLFHLVFYHFHALKFHVGGVLELSGDRYRISPWVYRNVYLPYFRRLRQAAEDLAMRGWFASHAALKGAPPQAAWWRRLKGFLVSNANRPRRCPEIFVQSCPVCDGMATRVRVSRLYDDRYGFADSFALRKCCSCGHSFLQGDFRNFDFSRLYTEFYPRSKQSVEGFVPVRELGGFRGWLLGEKSAAHFWVRPGESVLDVGCGFGESLEFHRRRGSRAAGIEADRNVEKIAQALQLDIRIGVFEPEMVGPERFDVVTLNQVLEHSVDPRGLLRNLAGCLAPGGRVILTIPNSHGFGARIFGRRWIHWHVPYHLQFFSRKSLKSLLDSTGSLRIESVRCVTHSNWVFFQLLAFLTYPAQGNRSAFWSSGSLSFLQKVLRKALGGALKFGVLSVYTRVLDLLGCGDNWVVVMQSTSDIAGAHQ